MERIFVHIPSYRDPELQPTLRDLFTQAEHPERIRVGVLLQIMPGADRDCSAGTAYGARVVCREVDARESRGVCWARHLLQRMWEGEEYVLQIDSHMRFAPGWDTNMIGMLQRCGTGRVLLSTYPPHYTPPSELHDDYITTVHPERFDEWGTLLLESHTLPLGLAPGAPIPGLFCGACFIFAPSSIIREVPYDPDLYFFGEEISLSARFWTNGWDIYHPNAPLVYHCWSREYRPTHWNDVPSAAELDRVSRRRVAALLGSGAQHSLPRTDLGVYGLGRERTLSEFEKLGGVDFSAMRIAARDGGAQASGRFEEPLPPFTW